MYKSRGHNYHAAPRIISVPDLPALTCTNFPRVTHIPYDTEMLPEPVVLLLLDDFVATTEGASWPCTSRIPDSSNRARLTARE